MDAQQVFYTLGIAFFIILSVFLIVLTFVVIFINNEIKRVSRKMRFSLRAMNGIIGSTWGMVRTAEMGLTGTVLKNLLRMFK